MLSRLSLGLCLVLMAVISAGCVPPSDEELEEINLTLEAAAPTLTAAAALTPTEPPPTLIPPSATPNLTELGFTDPSGDIVQCQTGEPMPDQAPFLDVGMVHVETDDSGLSFEFEFPETDDLAAEFTSTGSFLGILMLDDANNPVPPDPSIGTFGLGLLRVDAIWNGQNLDERVFVRTESGAFAEEQNNVEVAADGNRLRIKLAPSRLPAGINRAGFAALSFNSCDLVGVEFDYESGQPANGLLTIDIDLDLGF
jgi:hypothetical protein